MRLHFTRKGASWLNLVESWFILLTETSVRCSPFDSVRALTQHIRNNIDRWNRGPTRFVSTQHSADMIGKAVPPDR